MAVVFQGIAARYAKRIASNTKAYDYGLRRFPAMQLCWKYIDADRAQREGRSKL
jgi:hypothetical protein